MEFQLSIGKRNSRFAIITLGLLFLSTLFVSCAYQSRQQAYIPSLPRETRGASYQPSGRIKEKITYYRDYDFHTFLIIPFWDTAYYIVLDNGEKTYLNQVDGKEYDQHRTVMFELEGQNADGDPMVMEMFPPIAYLLRKVYENHPGTDVVLNASITDSCSGDRYIVPLVFWNWVMIDRQCELTIEGTRGVLR